MSGGILTDTHARLHFAAAVSRDASDGMIDKGADAIPADGILDYAAEAAEQASTELAESTGGSRAAGLASQLAFIGSQELHDALESKRAGNTEQAMTDIAEGSLLLEAAHQLIYGDLDTY